MLHWISQSVSADGSNLQTKSFDVLYHSKILLCYRHKIGRHPLAIRIPNLTEEKNWYFEPTCQDKHLGSIFNKNDNIHKNEAQEIRYIYIY